MSKEHRLHRPKATATRPRCSKRLSFFCDDRNAQAVLFLTHNYTHGPLGKLNEVFVLRVWVLGGVEHVQTGICVYVPFLLEFDKNHNYLNLRIRKLTMVLL